MTASQQLVDAVKLKLQEYFDCPVFELEEESELWSGLSHLSILFDGDVRDGRSRLKRFDEEWWIANINLYGGGLSVRLNLVTKDEVCCVKEE